MGLKLLLVVALLVCETISLDFAMSGPDGTPDDDDGTADITEGSGDSDIPDSLIPEIPLNAKNFTKGIEILYRGRNGINLNTTKEQLNAVLTAFGVNVTSITGGASGLILSHSVLVSYFFIFLLSRFE